MQALATIGGTAQVTVRSDEREMGHSTYLTHRLKSPKVLPVSCGPACSTLVLQIVWLAESIYEVLH